MNNYQNFATLEDLLESMAKRTQILKQEKQERKEMNKQEEALHNVGRGLYIVGSIDILGNVSFSPNPATHQDSNSARAECKRLALQNPGKAFMFVKLSGAELMPVSKPISY